MSEENTKVEVEKEASTFGWVPKEEFRGNEADWVDAETFVRRGKEINPILRKNNEILLKKLEAAQSEIQEVKKVAKEFEKFQKDSTERKVRELEAQLVQLKQEKKDAISSGDGEKVIALDDAIDEVKNQAQELKETPSEPKPQAVALDPVVKDWIGRNSWFGVDQTLTVRVNKIAEDLHIDRPDLIGQEFFDVLDEQLKEKFPTRFGKKERANPVEGSKGGNSRSGGASTKHSYANLPEDAKKACDRFVKQGLMKQEEYVASYDWS